MPKSRWPEIQDKLHFVEKWARDGLTEEQIAKNLGITRSTLSAYKLKNKDLVDAIKRGRAGIITEIENALVKRALGFNYDEVKTYHKHEDGKTVVYQEKTTRYLPPDVGACAILLKNKDRGNWSDNPQKLEIEREILELHKKAQELKTWST
jgi:transcriptional regulator with XRE-family HTH domain